MKAAVTALGPSNMADSYAAAWDEWEQSGEEALWENVAGDGLAVDDQDVPA
jgi:hypothetical protein